MATITTFKNMKMLLSSAKTMGTTPLFASQNPAFLPESAQLMSSLKKWNLKKVAAFYGTSSSLSLKVHAMIAAWDLEAHSNGGSAALGQFKGEAFAKLDVDHMSPKVQDYALDNIVIGSGLYGLLRGNDAIMHYRLDMGQKIDSSGLKTFWRPRGSALLKAICEDDFLVNIASAEYGEAFDLMGIDVYEVDFWQIVSGKRRAMSVFSKQARGLMARHLCHHASDGLDALEGFSDEGYLLVERADGGKRFVFERS